MYWLDGMAEIAINSGIISVFIYTHTKNILEFIAIYAMPSSQYIIISGLIRDLQLTAEHHIQRHADMLMSRLLLHHTLMMDRG